MAANHDNKPRDKPGTPDLPFLDPHIRLFGPVDQDLYTSFIEQLDKARKTVDRGGPILLELTTTGGEAETARRMALDIALVRERQQRELFFLGKSFVYSAGITVMAAFPVQARLLTRDTELLIHERRIEETVHLNGGLRCGLCMLRDKMAELESGRRLEKEGFEQLVAGSRMTLEDLMKKVDHADWYVPAGEAKDRGLVHEVI
jgi:ATP-dependent protease ClpP protease subunit